MIGDVDDVCATIGTQDWIYKAGGQTKALWESWYVGDQPAGYVTIFDGSFTFATIHTAGHEVNIFHGTLDFFLYFIRNALEFPPTGSCISADKSLFTLRELPG